MLFDSPDRVSWHLSTSWIFTIKSSYKNCKEAGGVGFAGGTARSCSYKNGDKRRALKSEGAGQGRGGGPGASSSGSGGPWRGAVVPLGCVVPGAPPLRQPHAAQR
jgi:hypothetical protein